jgi:hypothetical protein
MRASITSRDRSWGTEKATGCKASGSMDGAQRNLVAVASRSRACHEISMPRDSSGAGQ